MNLDDEHSIRDLDKSNMLGSIEELYLQCQQTWEEIQKIAVDEKYKSTENIVVVGMGGSALGPHAVKALYFNKLNLPIEIVNGYGLPAYADERTLVVLSSHSGTTEEVLNAANEAVNKKCLIMGITTGGKLADFLKTHNAPSYIFKEKYNPSNQPRMSLGYMILGTLGLFYKAGLINVENSEIESVISCLKSINEEWGQKIPTGINLAKQTSVKLHGKVVILVASEFLGGSCHTFNNQLNENAKNFSTYFVVPELNHHLMEGLSFPETNKENLVFLFINSELYSKRIQERFSLTKEVVSQNNIEILEFMPRGKTKLEQAFEVLGFGSYVGFYLAVLNGLNPSPIPWVNFFKERLGK